MNSKTLMPLSIMAVSCIATYGIMIGPKDLWYTLGVLEKPVFKAA